MSDYVQVPTRSLDYLERAISTVSTQVAAVGDYVSQIDGELQELKADFQRMMEEQRKAAAFQRALTEIVRIRQEIEQKFGSYKQVRDYMIGILQAADLSLIKESTISRCTEELMLSAPNYWLAPCLISLAAWIANDESLAKRAVKVAIDRDKEKTCLLFALVCRRNGRTDTCFEWLSEYFKLQKPEQMRRSIVAFIDAYANGVFGEDKDEVCSDQISSWIASLKQSNPEFDQEQRTYWKNYFSGFTPSFESRDAGYKALASICLKDDMVRVENTVSRILATKGDSGVINTIRGTYNAIIDKQKLIEEIDTQLVNLVTNYDIAEEPLRDEETYHTLVKSFKGDEDRAKRQMAAIRARRRDDPVDLVSRLREAVSEVNQPASAKKTAVVLLKDYIVDAYAEYVAENKESYPESIKLKINGKISGGFMKGESNIMWTGATADGSNYQELKKTLEEKYELEKAAAIPKIKVNPLAIFPGCLLIIPTILGFKSRNRKREEAAKAFDAQKAQKVALLNQALNARATTNDMVNEFYGKDGWNKFTWKEEEVVETPVEAVEEVAAAPVEEVVADTVEAKEEM